MKTLLTIFVTALTISLVAQNNNVPVQINLKDGGSINARHFGQFKCGNQSSQIENYVIIRGKYMGSVTEIKNYNDIEKIILEGYTTGPENSVGNEKGTVYIQRKNGKTFTLEEAEITLSCYGPGDKYNQIIVQVTNPITDKIAETTIDTKDISSIIFK